jgi:hypothetical protein
VKGAASAAPSIPPASEADCVKEIGPCCHFRCGLQFGNQRVSWKAIRTHHNVYFEAAYALSDILLIVRADAGIIGGDSLLEANIFAITGVIASCHRDGLLVSSTIAMGVEPGVPHEVSHIVEARQDI